MKKSQGFTLVEVMVVVVIIGILVSIGYPSYQEYTTRTSRSDAHTALLRMADMQERYYLQNQAYAPDTKIAELGGATTKEGYYTLNVSAANADSYTLNAVAVTTGPQANDTPCLTITLTSAGQRTPVGCW